MAAPIVGEKIIGACNAWRSFQTAIRRSASSSTCASVARADLPLPSRRLGGADRPICVY